MEDKNSDKNEVSNEIMKSFHNQFSENQNHQQTIFLQFFSAILVTAIPFGIVFVKTTDEAHFWNSIMDAEGNILSYGVSHLIGSWLLIQVALITLSAFTLKIAYSFRRDQMVVENIRKESMGTDLYKKIFGTKSFLASGKRCTSGKSFVPLFCAIFWQFSVFLQICSSLILFLRVMFISSMDLFKILPAIGLIATACICLSHFWRYYYYLKYRLAVDETEPDALRGERKINSVFLYFLDEKKRASVG